MGLLGEWDVKIKTPIGSLDIVYRFDENDSTVIGTAEGKGETVPLQDVTVTNASGVQQVTWRQSVTKPMRLNLDFDVTVDGDHMTGHSKAGRLPRSAVAGVRRPDPTR